MRTQIGTGLPFGQAARAFFGAELFVNVAHEVESAGQVLAVDHNLDPVALLNLSDRSTRKCLRGDMTNASSGRDAAEARVSKNCDMLAMRELF